MAIFLAIDAGGSKTTAALADEHRILARISAGSMKVLRVPVVEAQANLRTLLDGLVRDSGIDLRTVTRTCIGSSGASVPSVREWVRAALLERVGGELLLYGDEFIALDAAFPDAAGILVVAGTGSNVIGRLADGRTAHAGGWGPALADEGSGHWIAQQALRAAFRALNNLEELTDHAEPPVEGVPLTGVPLINRLVDELRLESVEALVEAVNAPGIRFAALVPVIVEAAAAGDPIASGVLAQAGRELANLVSQVIAKLRSAVPRLPAPPVAYTGGILESIPPVRNAMQSALRGVHPEIVFRLKAVDPLEGALLHARRG